MVAVGCGAVSRDAGLEQEISLLEAEVGSLKEERDRALTIGGCVSFDFPPL